jgi:hypothetical protein
MTEGKGQKAKDRGPMTGPQGPGPIVDQDLQSGHR